jgi:hypothetical protein
LQAAGQGWLGGAGIALLVLYSLAAALFVGRLAGGRRPRAAKPASFWRLWPVASTGVAAVCGGQALLARALGSTSQLGGGWTVLLVLCVLAGAVIALALHAAPAAAAFLQSLRPGAPRPGSRRRSPTTHPRRPSGAPARSCRSRAPAAHPRCGSADRSTSPLRPAVPSGAPSR